ncbi:hypothetical protein JXA88_10865 [Candidatus Fermentibacteria bacterium]|nr:hypothetical protein [Candidatus Fermentibacteria bacterium]
MPISDRDALFIQKRTRLLRSWKPAGILSLVILATTLAWLFIKSPALVNPIFVVNALETGSLERGTVELMAAVLPLAVLGCFFTTTVMIGFGFTALALEQRYMTIVRGLTQTASLPQDASDEV